MPTALAAQAGIALTTPWLVVTYALYALAFTCWVPVVALQMRARDLARHAVASSTSLPDEYYAAMRLRFALGWPAFLGLPLVFLLMVAKSELW